MIQDRAVPCNRRLGATRYVAKVLRIGIDRVRFKSLVLGVCVCVCVCV